MPSQQISTTAASQADANFSSPLRAARPQSFWGRLVGLPYLLWGVMSILIGALIAGLNPILVVVALILPGQRGSKLFFEINLLSAIFLFIGGALAIAELALFLPLKRRTRHVRLDKIDNKSVTVVLTAWNDEESIGLAVQDFASHPLVRRVVVVENDSSDGTAAVARKRGADVIKETRRGYGQCVYRALQEGSAFEDTQLTVLCEGDMTFRSFDLDKLIAFVPHADIVNGTRIVEQLRSRDTQLTTFMYYGNFFTAKLLEAKHIGHGTFTDVGTTYKLCRNTALRTLLPLLNPGINLEFNAHFMDTVLRYNLGLVECPISFHERVGASKGGNKNNLKALAVGLRMIKGIAFGWKR